MEPETCQFNSDADGLTISACAWPGPDKPMGVVLIAHGLAEYARRCNGRHPGQANE